MLSRSRSCGDLCMWPNSPESCLRPGIGVTLWTGEPHLRSTAFQASGTYNRGTTTMSSSHQNINSNKPHCACPLSWMSFDGKGNHGPFRHAVEESVSILLNALVTPNVSHAPNTWICSGEGIAAALWNVGHRYEAARTACTCFQVSRFPAETNGQPRMTTTCR